MKITIKVGILFAIVWMLIKFMYHIIHPNTIDLKITIFSNMLLLIGAISFGLYLHKKQEGFSQGNALSDIKSAMKSGVVYTVLVASFMYLYYAVINPEFNQHQISEVKTQIKLELENPQSLKKIKASQEAFEVMTKEQLYKELVKGPESFYAAKSTFVISLLSLLLLTTLYSILITVIYRQLLFRHLKR
jgi:hypothetical protein